MAPPAKIGSPWRRRLLIVALVFVVLLVALYFAVTSTAFVRSYVLPRVGQVLGAEVTVGDTSIEPFSRVELRQLRVAVPDREPLLEVGELRARYSVLALIQGRVDVSEVTLDGAKIHLVQNADGSLNLPAALRPSSAPAGRKPDARPAPALVPKVSLRNVTVSGLEFRRTVADKAGGVQTTRATGVELKLDRIENGGAGRLNLGAQLQWEDKAAAGPTASSRLGLKLAAAFDYSLTPELQPAVLKGTGQFEVTEASEAFRDLIAVTGRLVCDVATNELNQLALQFERNGQRLGEIKAEGTLDLARSEGRLKLDVAAIDRNVLNLAGARLGLDFQQSTLGGTTRLNLRNGGKLITGEGRLAGQRISVRQPAGATPPLEVDLNWEFTADLAAQKLGLQVLKLAARQGQTEVLRGGLDYPMEISWSRNTASSFTRSTLALNLRQIDLTEWRGLHGQTNLAGRLSADLTLTAVPGNQRLQLALNSALAGFSNATVRQSQLQARLNAAYAVKDGAHQLTGRASLANPAGAVGDFFPRGFQTAAVFDLANRTEELRINRLGLGITNNGASGGAVEVVGQWVPSAQRGEFNLKLDRVNQHAFAPWLDTVLAPRKLASATLAGTASVKVDLAARSVIGADLDLSGVSIAGAGASAGSPFGLNARLSAVSGNSLHELQELVITLPATDRAKNELRATGRIDLRRERPAPGSLTVRAESLDVTPLWDLLAPVSTEPAPAAKSATNAVVAAAAPRAEPPAWTPPMKQFAAEISIGVLHARSISISNFVCTARLADSLLAVKPFECSLNGAPVKVLLDANLGVPGYLYDLELETGRVPLAPLMASVAASGAGTARGDLELHVALKGAGITDSNLQQNLKGEVRMTLANAAIQLAPGWKQGVATVLATLLRVPELAQSPIAWANAAVTLGAGQLQIADARVGSDAFIANVVGDIPLRVPLTNSPLALPVRLELRRSLAQKAGLTLSGPADAPFAALPDFLKLKGTVGAPKADIDKVALGGVLLQTLGGIPGVAGQKAGSLIQGIGGLLTGQVPGAPATNAVTTNAVPATNKPAPFNPLDLLRRKP